MIVNVLKSAPQARSRRKALNARPRELFASKAHPPALSASEVPKRGDSSEARSVGFGEKVKLEIKRELMHWIILGLAIGIKTFMWIC